MRPRKSSSAVNQIHQSSIWMKLTKSKSMREIFRNLTISYPQLSKLFVSNYWFRGKKASSAWYWEQSTRFIRKYEGKICAIRALSIVANMPLFPFTIDRIGSTQIFIRDISTLFFTVLLRRSVKISVASWWNSYVSAVSVPGWKFWKEFSKIPSKHWNAERKVGLAKFLASNFRRLVNFLLSAARVCRGVHSGK